MTARTNLLSWPGKSTSGDGVEHPALYHMLDVAAVAEILLAQYKFEPKRQAGLVLLVALHDLGKIGAQFRNMIRDGTSQVHGRHWEITELWLRKHDALLAERLPHRYPRRQQLYAAVAGHHGRPPDRDLDHQALDMLKAAGKAAETDAGTCIDAFLALWPEADLSDLSRGETIALSWWLPGLIAAADWIGSNTSWFEAQAANLSPAAYLSETRERAEGAVAEAGLRAPAPANRTIVDFDLWPMQQAAVAIPLREGPMLAVMEDETGSGKTEAAMLLAQRMQLAGKGRGLYFALPTMATSDAMFDRACDMIGGMFAAAPTVTLAHGRSSLSRRFRDLIVGGSDRTDDVAATTWLADDRRRSLLADVGVGTIDQALLSVLPSRFSTLRHYALSGKVLIVDEVHEMGTPYMGEALARLLQAHAMAGGSAILMTATLPLDLRARLVDAFEAGAGRATHDDGDAAYPALMIPGGAVQRDLPTRTGPRGAIAVSRMADVDAALDHLVARAAEGAACVWVRNAVDDAIGAAEALRARGATVDLLHARYALSDRKRHEAAVLGRFGKTGAGRSGRILVATQIVESSLDLDFDVMVSDLAPMAALIQRAGRLWRHMEARPKAGRPISDPVLHVVTPDPDVATDAHWLRGVLDRGAWVYDLPTQWRTAKVLFQTGRIEAPGNLRDLIEPVHGSGTIPVPDGLFEAEMETLGTTAGERAHAWQNLVELEQGYRQAGGASDDATYPTRLGREQRPLMLARRVGGALHPRDGVGASGWMLSEVQAAASKLDRFPLPDQETPEIAAIKADWPAWRRDMVRLCPMEGDGRICAGLRYDPERGLLFEEELGM